MENWTYIKTFLTYISLSVLGGVAGESRRIRTARQFLLVIFVSIFIGINYYCAVQGKDWSAYYKMLGASVVGYLGINGLMSLFALLVRQSIELVERFDLKKTVINIFESIGKRD